MSYIRFSSIVENSLVDGDGRRTVLYFQGCSIACPGCQNKAIWDKFAGHQADAKDLARHLVSKSQDHHNYTIQGGEPTEQPEALTDLLGEIRNLDPDAHI